MSILLFVINNIDGNSDAKLKYSNKEAKIVNIKSKKRFFSFLSKRYLIFL